MTEDQQRRAGLLAEVYNERLSDYERLQAMDGYLKETDTGYKDASAWQQQKTQYVLLQDIKENRDVYLNPETAAIDSSGLWQKLNSYERGTAREFIDKSRTDYERAQTAATNPPPGTASTAPVLDAPNAEKTATEGQKLAASGVVESNTGVVSDDQITAALTALSAAKGQQTGRT